ncbi:MAG: amino acid ABC transporter substrate-binding protein [Sulfobacillus benefaciens]|uniref:Amino acid ABC transporter substrate-binding protein n=1 Tax=Sulfobacillus benefaciens TaxID=453960 RepID=A0A2T2XGI7_9FIRM|nr:MAG: amino acid ABC transporter substrate-binding protein [Sulfobacillus benefaciens]
MLKRGRKWSLVAGVFASSALMMGLSACGGAGSPTSSGSSSHSPYVLGMSISETGPYSSLGVPEVDSAKLAVQQINAKGGVNGHPLKLVVLNSNSSATTAVENFRQLMQNDSPLGLLGCASTGSTMAAIPEIERGQVPLISFASDAEVIQPVSQRQWIFKVPPVDITPMQVILNYLKAHHLMRVAFVYGNFSYGTGALSDFNKIAPPQGFTLVASEPVDLTATNVTPQLASLKSANPQAVLVWDIPPSADTVATDYRSLGITAPIFFSDGVSNDVFISLAKNAVNGVYVASTKLLIASQLPASDPQKSVLTNYINAYDKEYQSSAGPANMFGGFGYDGVYLYKDAIEAAGANPTPTSVRNALEHLNYNGVTGVMHMTPTNHNGLDPRSEVLIKIVNDQWKWVPGYYGN